MKKVKQTDFDGKIKQYGCLFMSLLDVAAEVSESRVRNKDVEVLYNVLTSDGCMNENCFINNHTIALEYMLSYFNSFIQLNYVGAQYIGKPDDSWGRNYGDFIILQVKTPSYSHFRRIDYDPWEPSLPFNSVLSVRYYSIK